MRFGLKSLALVGIAIGTIVGCSSDPERPAPAGDLGGTTNVGGGGGGGRDASATDATTEGGPDSGVVCTTIQNSALVIDRVGVVGDPPVSTGGTISDGRYELTEYRIYVGAGGIGGPTGVTAKSALAIAAGKIEQVIEIGGNSPSPEKRVITSYTTSASTLLRTNVCPADGSAAQYQFTASDTVITITDALSKEAFVFTRR